MNKVYRKFFSMTLAAHALNACGVNSQESQLHEAWNNINNPAIISSPTYEKVWSKLPLDGVLATKGWSEDYYATYKGGISLRWKTQDYSYALAGKEGIVRSDINKLSPAEKYDVFMGRFDFPTVQDERRRTQIMKTVPDSPEYEKDYSIASWEGLCHGWAPAAHNFLEPQASIKVQTAVGEMDFYASDVKALLLYYQQYPGNRSTRTSFVAERCNTKFSELNKQLSEGEITQEAWAAAREGACADVNAATFHLVLTNEIGIKKEGFIVDVTRDAEVWNHPVNQYQSVVQSEALSAGEGAAVGTVKEITVETRMNYSIEVYPSEVRVGAIEDKRIYRYILELNAADEIIGGRWIGDERPDFLWRESAPKFRGYFANLRSLYELALKAVGPAGLVAPEVPATPIGPVGPPGL